MSSFYLHKGNWWNDITSPHLLYCRIKKPNLQKSEEVKIKGIQNENELTFGGIVYPHQWDHDTCQVVEEEILWESQKISQEQKALLKNWQRF